MLSVYNLAKITVTFDVTSSLLSLGINLIHLIYITRTYKRFLYFIIHKVSNSCKNKYLSSRYSGFGTFINPSQVPEVGNA